MSQAQAKRKFTKIGTVWNKKDDANSFFIRLNNEGTKPEYNFTVELTVKDGNGKVVAQQTGGTLTLSDPRKSPFAKPEQLAKVPNLQFDVLIPNKES